MYGTYSYVKDTVTVDAVSIPFVSYFAVSSCSKVTIRLLPIYLQWNPWSPSSQITPLFRSTPFSSITVCVPYDQIIRFRLKLAFVT